MNLNLNRNHNPFEPGEIKIMSMIKRNAPEHS